MKWRGLHIEVAILLGRLQQTKQHQHGDVVEAALARAYWSGMRRAADRIARDATKLQSNVVASTPVADARIAGMWDAVDNLQKLLVDVDRV
jgi:hypothetical protein